MKKYSFIIISFLLITQSLKAQYANKAWGDVVLYKIHIVTNGNSGFQAFWIPKTLAKVACHAFLHEEIHK